MNYNYLSEETVSRYQKLFDEFIFAIKQMKTIDIISITKEIPSIFIHITERRIKGFCKTISSVAKSLFRISKDTYFNYKQGNIKKYTIDEFNSCKEKFESIKTKLLEICKSGQKKPKEFITEYGPFFLAFALGINWGSGGLDGDGGLPDLDLEFGIGAHRSILSHGIIMGITAECAIIIISLLSDVVLKKLPKEHDIFWDNVNDKKQEIISGLLMGISTGLAYHLTIDGTLDIKPYSHLPFHNIPMKGHQLIILSQAGIEGIDVFNKKF